MIEINWENDLLLFFIVIFYIQNLKLTNTITSHTLFFKFIDNLSFKNSFLQRNIKIFQNSIYKKRIMHTSSKSLRIKTQPKYNRNMIHIRTQSKQSECHLAEQSKNNFRRIYDLNDKLKQINIRYQSQIEEKGEDQYLVPLEIYDTICEGQFSKVVKARNIQEGKNYALKKIVVDEYYDNREQKICKIVKSNFIVDCKHIYRNKKKNLQEEVNILMKLYRFNFEDVLVSKPQFDSLNIKIMLYQMTRALHYLHMKGICHRDIRPSNFLVDGKGRLFLTDFGSAKRIDKKESSVCYIGGRSYRAPQLHLGCKVYNQTVDIWSLGCIVLEMITGQQIFKGSGGIDCLLNIGRYLGTKELKRMPGQSEIVKLLPSLPGKGLGCLLKDQESSLVNLVTKMLTINTKQRIKTIDILVHDYFEELRDEKIFAEIIQNRCDISDFFDFSPIQFKNYQQHYARLIPFWKRQRKGKFVRKA